MTVNCLTLRLMQVLPIVAPQAVADTKTPGSMVAKGTLGKVTVRLWTHTKFIVLRTYCVMCNKIVPHFVIAAWPSVHDSVYHSHGHLRTVLARRWVHGRRSANRCRMACLFVASLSHDVQLCWNVWRCGCDKKERWLHQHQGELRKTRIQKENQ